jgi:uncharacterized protein
MGLFEERSSVILENHGQKIFGVLHLPTGLSSKMPAVLILHGFGGNKVGTNRLYVTQAQKLSARGIAVFRLDFRGCGDSEGELVDTTIESEISDAIQGIHFLQKHSQIDSTRLGILGISLGGAVSILTAKRIHSIKSLGLWAPVASGRVWQAEWEKLHPKQHAVPAEKEICYQGKAIGQPFLQEFIKMDLNQSVRELGHVPMLHIHGELDTTVTTEHCVCFEQWRKEASAKNRFIRLPESDHRFSNLDEQQTLLQETLDWFHATL